MTMPNRTLSLDEVLDEFFYGADKPTPEAILRICEEHPEFREDIIEFAALWAAHDAAPVPSREVLGEASEESVSRLQSYVLNLLHEQGAKPAGVDDSGRARAALEGLRGGKLKRAAAAVELGESSLLLTKVLMKSITNVPTCVVRALASYLGVTTTGLESSLGLRLVGTMSYKATDKPNGPVAETWEQAVQALPVSAEEKARLLALQHREYPV